MLVRALSWVLISVFIGKLLIDKFAPQSANSQTKRGKDEIKPKFNILFVFITILTAILIGIGFLLKILYIPWGDVLLQLSIAPLILTISIMLLSKPTTKKENEQN